MVQIPSTQSTGRRSAVGQAVAFNARERSRGFRNIGLGLSRTHRFEIPTAAIASAAFPGKTSPITFATAVRVTNAGAYEGMVFEIGSSSIGTAVWLESGAIGVHVGDGDSGGGFSGAARLSAAIAPAANQVYEIALSIIPGNAKVVLWVNGRVEAESVAGAETFPSGSWADAGDGSFASAINGTTVNLIPAGSQVAPSGFSAIEPLSVYAGQVSRHLSR